MRKNGSETTTKTRTRTNKGSEKKKAVIKNK